MAGEFVSDNPYVRALEAAGREAAGAMPQAPAVNAPFGQQLVGALDNALMPITMPVKAIGAVGKAGAAALEQLPGPNPGDVTAAGVAVPVSAPPDPTPQVAAALAQGQRPLPPVAKPVPAAIGSPGGAYRRAAAGIQNAQQERIGAEKGAAVSTQKAVAAQGEADALLHEEIATGFKRQQVLADAQAGEAVRQAQNYRAIVDQHNREMGEVRKTRNDYREWARHPGIASMDEYLDLRERAKNKDGTLSPEEQAAARMRLQKGQEAPAKLKDATDYIGAALMAVGAGFGGFAQAYVGGENAGLRGLNNLIDTKTREQEQMIARREQAGQDADNELSQLRTKLGDDLESAKMLYQMGVIERYQHQLNAVAAASNSDQSKAMAQKALADADAKKAGLEQQLEERQTALKLEGLAQTETLKIKGAEADYQAMAAREAARLKALKAAGGKELKDDTIRRLSEGKAGIQAVRDLKKRFQQASGGPNFLNAVTKMFPGTKASSYEEARKIMAAQLVLAFTGTGGSEEQRQELMSLIPNASDSEANAQTKWDELERHGARSYNANVQGLRDAGYDTGGFFPEEDPVKARERQQSQ